MNTNICETTGSTIIDAESIKGTAVDASGIGDGKVLAYDSVNDKLIYVVQTGGGSGSSTFVDLIDTPNSFVGQATKKLVVNNTETGLEFVDDTSGGASAFLDLTDTPATYVNQGFKLFGVSDSEDSVVIVENRHVKRTNTFALTSVDIVNRKLIGTNIASESGVTVGSLIVGVTSGAEGVVIGTNGTDEILLSLDSNINAFIGTETVGTYAFETRFLEQLSEIPRPTQADIDNKRVLARKTDGNGFEYVNNPQNFVTLTDTPNTLVGNAGKIVRVNDTEDSLEFADKINDELPRWRGVSRVTQAVPQSPADAVVKAEVAKEFYEVTYNNGEFTINLAGQYLVNVDLNCSDSSISAETIETWFEFYDAIGTAWIPLDDSAKSVTMTSTSDGSVHYTVMLGLPADIKVRMKMRGTSTDLSLQSSLLSNGVVIPSVIVDIALLDAVLLGDGSGGGATTFKALTDTPSNYLTHGGKFVKVNQTETGLEFINEVIPSNTSDLVNDSNFVVDASYVHTDNNYTTAEKNKLATVGVNAEQNVQSDWNVADTLSDAFIKNKPTIPTATSDLTNDSGFIGDAPADGKEYVRKDNLWAVSTGTGGGGGSVITLVNVSEANMTLSDSNYFSYVSLYPGSPTNGKSYAWTDLGNGWYNFKLRYMVALKGDFVMPTDPSAGTKNITIATPEILALTYKNGETFQAGYNKGNAVHTGFNHMSSGEVVFIQGLGIIVRYDLNGYEASTTLLDLEYPTGTIPTTTILGSTYIDFTFFLG